MARSLVRAIACILLLFLPLLSPGADKRFDFTQLSPGALPEGFRPALAGTGHAPDWQILIAEVPSALESITPDPQKWNRRPVLAQLSQDRTDEHFPLLVYEEESFGDFSFSTKVKIVSGKAEQMAGIAFRFQDESNFYYVRASALGNTFRFFKVVKGQRSEPIGQSVPVESEKWFELTVECKGNQIRCLLGGNEVIPPLIDTSFSSGKIAFLTKSDSVAYFSDARIQYKPLVSPAQKTVDLILDRYPRLIDLRVFARRAPDSSLEVVAAKSSQHLGAGGGSVEADVLAQNAPYLGKNRKEKSVTVTLPLHDRNGDPIAAVRIVMESFAGQTEKNVLARAVPIVKALEYQTRGHLHPFE